MKQVFSKVKHNDEIQLVSLPLPTQSLTHELFNFKEHKSQAVGALIIRKMDNQMKLKLEGELENEIKRYQTVLNYTPDLSEEYKKEFTYSIETLKALRFEIGEPLAALHLDILIKMEILEQDKDSIRSPTPVYRFIKKSEEASVDLPGYSCCQKKKEKEFELAIKYCENEREWRNERTLI